MSGATSPKDCMAAFVAALIRRDIEAALALLTDDVAFFYSNGSSLWGKAAFAAAMTASWKRVERLHLHDGRGGLAGGVLAPPPRSSAPSHGRGWWAERMLSAAAGARGSSAGKQTAGASSTSTSAPATGSQAASAKPIFRMSMSAKSGHKTPARKQMGWMAPAPGVEAPMWRLSS